MFYPLVNKRLQAELQNLTNIDVVWLYGSHAKGNAEENSDIDLAVAFHSHDNLDLYACDDLAYAMSIALNERISVVDINKIPTPLSYAVITDGKVLLSRNDLRLHKEEQRIWSKWEEYEYEFKRYH